MKNALLALILACPMAAHADCTVEKLHDDVWLQMEKQLTTEATIQVLVRCDEPTSGELWITAPDRNTLVGPGSNDDIQTLATMNGQPIDRSFNIQADQTGTLIPIHFKVISARYPTPGDYRANISLRLEY
ncbi:TPA: hypothetical protein ACOEC0_001138 [Stenotrophomonas maltophilia]